MVNKKWARYSVRDLRIGELQLWKNQRRMISGPLLRHESWKRELTMRKPFCTKLKSPRNILRILPHRLHWSQYPRQVTYWRNLYQGLSLALLAVAMITHKELMKHSHNQLVTTRYPCCLLSTLISTCQSSFVFSHGVFLRVVEARSSFLILDHCSNHNANVHWCVKLLL